MSQKQQLLHELLKEDQEPFQLKKYISDRGCQLKEPNSLHVKKSSSVSSTFQASHFTCKNHCFFGLTNSPDPTESPLPIFDIHSLSNKSPCRKNPNAIFLHISPKTYSLLQDAAVRIQKQSKNKKTNGFGLLGSLFKKLSSRKNKKREIITTSAQRKQDVIFETRKSPGSGCSRNGRRSSTIWSGSSEEKSFSFDLELGSFRSSTSGGDSDSEDQTEEEFGNYYLENNNNNNMQFCESPFRFVLLRSSPSPGRRTPDFTSPANSPSRQKDKVVTDVGSPLKFQVQAKEDEEEENKEQCSPVSVLDPPFEDDDDGCNDQMEDDGFDLEGSYAIVQRAKKQLLQKLHRFEKLAGLDPVELEKRMVDQEEEVDYDDLNGASDTSGLKEEADGIEDEQLDLSNGEKNIDMFIIEEVSRSSFNKLVKMPKDMKRLVSDVIDEEENDQSCFANGEVMAKRVCKRFESWKNVEFNTIDMMVEQDFKRERGKWKRFPEQVEEAALQIELGIFGLLMEELTDDLVVLTGIL